jgi:hypothetical protein
MRPEEKPFPPIPPTPDDTPREEPDEATVPPEPEPEPAPDEDDEPGDHPS